MCLSSNARRLKSSQKSKLGFTKVNDQSSGSKVKLPAQLHYIRGYGRFYDKDQNLKYNVYFQLECEEMEEFLKVCKVYSFDCTFSIQELIRLTSKVEN